MASEKEQPQTLSFRNSMSVLRELFQFAKPYKYTFLVSFIFLALISGITAYLPLVIRGYIDDYLATNSATMAITIRVVTFYGVLTVLKSLFTYSKDYLFNTAAEKTVGNIRNELYEKVVDLGMRYFDQTPVGTVVSRVTNDTETIKEFWTVFINIATGLFNVAAISIAMFSLNWRLALVFVAFLPLLFAMVVIYQRRSVLIYGRMRAALSRLNAKLNESISGISIIQKFNQETRMAEEFDVINQKYVEARRSMYSMNALLLQPAIKLIESVALVAILMIFGYQDFVINAVDVGIIYAFTSYARSFFQPIGQMMNGLSTLQDGVVSGKRIQNLLNEDELAPESNEKSDSIITEGHIEVKNLSFSYDGENEILHDISFEAKPGQTVALVGQTGSGKSSIINVLMRFYDYHKGEVRIDGHSLKDIPLKEIRKKLGLVLQDSFLFYGNIANNIRMYDKNYTDADVRKAGEFVHADDFVSQLNKGYQSTVIERGDSFSAGEKQLISFARTILRSPSILILDEATANIDTETEKIIQRGIDKLKEDRTTFIIAHRLSTIKDADVILVMKDGNVIESGNHEELIKENGFYAELYNSQFNN